MSHEKSKWTFETFNPDLMEQDELREFANWARLIWRARPFFGGTTPKNHLSAFVALKRYAEHKADAIQARERGEIQTALEYERVCQIIYTEDIPDWLKW